MLPAPPSLRGVARDHGSRRAAAVDFGRLVDRFPAAVARPRSAAEVVTLLSNPALASTPVTVRGSGHGVAGRCLGTGIVLDTSLLADVSVQGREVTVGAGARWSDVVAVTLAAGAMPPVVPDSLALSVGGTAIAGGYGESSLRWGTVADNVVAAEAVAGGTATWCHGDDASRLLADLRSGASPAVLTALRLRLVDAAPTVRVTTVAGRLADLVDYATSFSTQVDGAAIECTRHRHEWRGQLTLRHAHALELRGIPGTTVDTPWAQYLDSAAPVTSGAARRAHPWASCVIASHDVARIVDLVGDEDPALLGSRGRLTLRPVTTDRGSNDAASGAWLVDVIRVIERPTAPIVVRALAANRAIAGAVHACGGRIYRAATVLDMADL